MARDSSSSAAAAAKAPASRESTTAAFAAARASASRAAAFAFASRSADSAAIEDARSLAASASSEASRTRRATSSKRNEEEASPPSSSTPSSSPISSSPFVFSPFSSSPVGHRRFPYLRRRSSPVSRRRVRRHRFEFLLERRRLGVESSFRDASHLLRLLSRGGGGPFRSLRRDDERPRARLQRPRARLRRLARRFDVSADEQRRAASSCSNASRRTRRDGIRLLRRARARAVFTRVSRRACQLARRLGEFRLERRSGARTSPRLPRRARRRAPDETSVAFDSHRTASITGGGAAAGSATVNARTTGPEGRDGGFVERRRSRSVSSRVSVSSAMFASPSPAGPDAFGGTDEWTPRTSRGRRSGRRVFRRVFDDAFEFRLEFLRASGGVRLLGARGDEILLERAAPLFQRRRFLEVFRLRRLGVRERARRDGLRRLGTRHRRFGVATRVFARLARLARRLVRIPSPRVSQRPPREDVPGGAGGLCRS